MVTLAIRLRPEGLQDLAWTRHAIDDLHDLYGFLVKAYAQADLAETARPLTSDELQRAVDGVVATSGMPVVRFRQGSLVVELSQVLDATVGVQALLALGYVLKKGPELAALPNRVKQAWYSSREDALGARLSYERLRGEGAAEVIDEMPSDGEGETMTENRPQDRPDRPTRRPATEVRQRRPNESPGESIGALRRAQVREGRAPVQACR